MKTLLEHVTCARLPAAADLAALAGLRRVEKISVIPEGDHVWVFWEDGDEKALRTVLPIAGVDLYEKRDDGWVRAGRRLRSFGVPPNGEPIPLHRAIFPEPFSAEPPGNDVSRPMPLQMIRDTRPRPTTAALCPLVEVGQWADSATSAALEAVRGAVRGDLALLIGRSLPLISGSTRYWGRSVLVPIGFEPRPGLPEDSLRETLGASSGEVLRLVPVGEGVAIEVIPASAFRPLTRAGVRLALGARSS